MNPPHRGHQATWGGFYSRNGQTCSSLTGRTSGLPHQLVPVEASMKYYRALRAAGVPVEMHLFGHGRHGSGLGLGDPSLDLWPTLLESWLRSRGVLTPETSAPATAPAA